MRLLLLTKRPAVAACLAATKPLPLAPTDAERLFRYTVAIATQYRGQGAGWELLLTAGFSAVAEFLAQLSKEADYLAWWVRQGVAKIKYQLQQN